MRIPSFTRIITETLPPEVQKWVGQISEPLNSFMLTMKNGLAKGITINDNLSGALKVLTVTGNVVDFSYVSSRPPKAVILGGWTCTTNATWAPTTVGVSMKWTNTDGAIFCTFYGFDAAEKYTVSLVIFDD